MLEYVAGETLQARWRREGRLAPGAALAVVLEVARALEDAHAHGMVHRDLKPRNVKLVDGQVKVLDFGIARVAELPGLTVPGDLLGTPAYAPPEWASGTADVRADIYALGVILFALLEGEVPFRGPTALAVLRQHETAPLPPTAYTPPGGAAGAAALPGQGPRAALPDPRRAGRGPGGAPPAPWSRGPGRGGGRRRRAPRAGRRHTGDAPGAPPAAPDLPVALSSFVGREREGAAVRGLLRGAGGAPGAGARLVTLTGPGGTGKTRLALHVAAGAAADYPDGVRLVELAPLADAALVPHAVAAALGAREVPGQAVAEAVADFVGPKRLLLVLDNCEHLVDACAALADDPAAGLPATCRSWPPAGKAWASPGRRDGRCPRSRSRARRRCRWPGWPRARPCGCSPSGPRRSPPASP